ncbi:hypothetical protein HFD88_005530 [Aspergillus terreus]|nr:hypothetical protein HFD88_005530 [Aspergillus terreus]
MSVIFEVFRGSPEGKIVAGKTTRTLQPNEVYIETTYSGLCGTDEHYLRSGQALGHEGVGVVRQLGRDVTNVKIGQRVGFGYTYYVCGVCEKCLSDCVAVMGIGGLGHLAIKLAAVMGYYVVVFSSSKAKREEA